MPSTTTTNPSVYAYMLGVSMKWEDPMMLPPYGTSAPFSCQTSQLSDAIARECQSLRDHLRSSGVNFTSVQPVYNHVAVPHGRISFAERYFLGTEGKSDMKDLSKGAYDKLSRHVLGITTQMEEALAKKAREGGVCLKADWPFTRAIDWTGRISAISRNGSIAHYKRDPMSGRWQRIAQTVGTLVGSSSRRSAVVRSE